MVRYDPSVTLLKMAAAMALLVFGLGLLAPVPPLVGPVTGVSVKVSEAAHQTP